MTQQGTVKRSVTIHEGTALSESCGSRELCQFSLRAVAAAAVAAAAAESASAVHEGEQERRHAIRRAGGEDRAVRRRAHREAQLDMSNKRCRSNSADLRSRRQDGPRYRWIQP